MRGEVDAEAAATDALNRMVRVAMMIAGRAWRREMKGMSPASAPTDASRPKRAELGRLDGPCALHQPAQPVAATIRRNADTAAGDASKAAPESPAKKYDSKAAWVRAPPNRCPR